MLPHLSYCGTLLPQIFILSHVPSFSPSEWDHCQKSSLCSSYLTPQQYVTGLATSSFWKYVLLLSWWTTFSWFSPTSETGPSQFFFWPLLTAGPLNGEVFHDWILSPFSSHFYPLSRWPFIQTLTLSTVCTFTTTMPIFQCWHPPWALDLDIQLRLRISFPRTTHTDPISPTSLHFM